MRNRGALRYVLLLIVPVVALASASDQVADRAADLPMFEAASIKSNKSGTPTVSTRMLPTSLNVVNLPVRLLIIQAYRLRPYQIRGGPSWLDSDRFDISAKAPDGSRADQIPLMLRALLIDRFKLVTHIETKDAETYALVMASSDGTLGPKLSWATDDCDEVSEERRAARARSPGQAPRTAPSPTGRPVCGFRPMSRPGRNGMPVIHIQADRQSIDDLARQLESTLDRPVVNRTGLAGLFDYELEFSRTPPGAPQAPVDDGPTVFEAVQQLGMKLESTRGPVEYLVIDSVEKPVDD